MGGTPTCWYRSEAFDDCSINNRDFLTYRTRTRMFRLLIKSTSTKPFNRMPSIINISSLTVKRKMIFYWEKHFRRAAGSNPNLSLFSQTANHFLNRVNAFQGWTHWIQCLSKRDLIEKFSGQSMQSPYYGAGYSATGYGVYGQFFHFSLFLIRKIGVHQKTFVIGGAATASYYQQVAGLASARVPYLGASASAYAYGEWSTLKFGSHFHILMIFFSSKYLKEKFQYYKK